MLGDFDGRKALPASIRNRCRAPIIALSEERSLEQTLELFTAGIDDVVRKPVHVKELVVRADAVWRRVNEPVRTPRSTVALSRPSTNTRAMPPPTPIGAIHQTRRPVNVNRAELPAVDELMTLPFHAPLDVCRVHAPE